MLDDEDDNDDVTAF